MRQKEQSDDSDRPHLLRLVFAGRVMFMHLIEKSNMLFGRLHLQMLIVNLR